MTYTNFQIQPIRSFLANKIKFALRYAACLRGHLLIEDTPGVGKTTLAHTLAKLLGLNYQRIQFTSDILPADMIGASILDAKNHDFKFHPGPVFNQLVLADEINRATPKAQSALLEAMEVHHVTIEGKTYPLPNPFFVIAPQNPPHQIRHLPAAGVAIRSFLMRLELGYPDHDAERQLLKGQNRHSLIESFQVNLPPEQLLNMQDTVTQVYVSNTLLDYCRAIISFTRTSSDYLHGLSPRAGLALLTAAQAWAFMDQHDTVLPEDIQAVLAAITGHRLRSGNNDSAAIVTYILAKVAVH